MVVSAKLGINFTCCAPKELFPEEKLVKQCMEIAKETGYVTKEELELLKKFKENQETWQA